MMSELPLVYERVERQLASADVESGGAEVHGIICGLVCAGRTDAFDVLIAELMPDEPGDNLLAEECKRSIQQLHAETVAAIEGPGLGFTPFLPDDEQPLKMRAEAISDWCQGFLYGIGLGGVAPERQLSKETREALNDLAEITRMDRETLEESEEEEDALIEIGEFLWVAAMLVREELVADPTERS